MEPRGGSESQFRRLGTRTRHDEIASGEITERETKNRMRIPTCGILQRERKMEGKGRMGDPAMAAVQFLH